MSVTFFGPFLRARQSVFDNSHTLDELKQSIHEKVTSTKVTELKLVSNNLFKGLELCLRAEGRNFEHLLVLVSFFKQFIYFQRCMHL